jgi:uncharacterized NAD(P)/FAD-binding protein YdhS
VSESMKRVAIVGAGFSGAMLAARLAESGVACVLINATSDFGLGVAYSTPFEGHLLNVRSNRMTAIEGAGPTTSSDWLAANRPELAAPSDFAPRKVYGDYVRARLAAVEAARPGLIERRVAGVQAITATGLTLSDGGAVSAGATVLCSGNPAPNAAGEPAGGRGHRRSLGAWGAGPDRGLGRHRHRRHGPDHGGHDPAAGRAPAGPARRRPCRVGA